jgi:hypothetical protein
VACGACTVVSPADAGPTDAPRADASPVVCDPGATIGQPCEHPIDCDDGCYCTGVEVCLAGVCTARAAPCVDAFDCTTDGCDELLDRCDVRADDGACDDDDVCNGAETCVPGRGCRPGPRLSCSDGDPCTIGRCDPALGCSFVPRDLDGDGYVDVRCGGDDCDDDPVGGEARHPGAVEVCDNLVDDDCDGITDYRDLTCTASNDDCDSAELLPGPGTYVRTTRGATSDHPLGCRPTGIDTVFRFTLPTAQDVDIALVVEGSSGAVAVRPAGSCASGPDTYCATEDLLARNLEAGDYFAIVRTGTGATFSLTLSFLSASPVQATDVCDASTVDISAGGSFAGFFTDVFDDYRLACRTGTTSYRDVAYRLTLTESSDVVLTGSSAGTSTASTYLSLVRDCSSPETTLACVQRSSVEIRRRSLPAGTYFVLLESSSSSARTWSLDAAITPAAPRAEGDACSSELDITDAIVTLPLTMLELDYGTRCGGSTTAARDASFTFHLDAISDVVLHTDVGGVHYVSVAATCGDPAGALTCVSGTPSTDQRLLRLAAGDYHVTVSTALASGSITASARVEPPTFPPSDDTCSGATDLSDGVVVTSSLAAASDDVISCGEAGSPDTVHRVVLGTERNVTVLARRTDGSTEPLTLGLRSDCPAPSADQACTSGSPALLNRTLPAGTHYLVVESAAGAAGPYSIVAFLADP